MLMRAPSYIPSAWTTASGSFQPKEADLAFDANSAVGANGAALSKSNGRSGGSLLGKRGSQHSHESYDSVDKAVVQVEIEDPIEREAFYKRLDEVGIKPTIVVDDDYSVRNPVSVISLGDASYILDLAQQREMRENDRHEEALEEALDLYKTALAEGATDDERMFLAILNEVKKELHDKYVEEYQQKDEWLDEALQAELERREKLAKEPKNQNQQEEASPKTQLDDGRRATRVDEIIEWEGWDGYDENEDWHGYSDYYDDYPEDWDGANANATGLTDALPSSSKTAEIPKKKKGGGGCCGKDVEDSVVISDAPRAAKAQKHTPQSDPAFFTKLKKKKAEKEKKEKDTELLLGDDDMWWKNAPIEVTVPEIEDDQPVLSFHSRVTSIHSRTNSFFKEKDEKSVSGRLSRSSLDTGLSSRVSGTTDTNSRMSMDTSNRTNGSGGSGSQKKRKGKRKDKNAPGSVSSFADSGSSKASSKKKSKSKVVDAVETDDAEQSMSKKLTKKKSKVKKSDDDKESLPSTPKKKKSKSNKSARSMDAGDDQPLPPVKK